MNTNISVVSVISPGEFLEASFVERKTITAVIPRSLLQDGSFVEVIHSEDGHV